MPVFDEAGRVSDALGQLLATAFPFSYELIVVDDGSTDGTRTILREYPWPDHAHLLEHSHNQGKGAAVRTGLSQARGRFTAVLDADLEYQPADLVELMVPLQQGLARAVFGVRAFDGHSSHSFWFVIGNRSVTLALNVLFNVYLHDLMTCQKVIDTQTLRSLSLRENGFAIEAEIAARLIQHGERIYEIPVRYKARSHDEGKKLEARDGLRVMRTLVRCRFDRRSRAVQARPAR